MNDDEVLTAAFGSFGQEIVDEEITTFPPETTEATTTTTSTTETTTSTTELKEITTVANRMSQKPVNISFYIHN